MHDRYHIEQPDQLFSPSFVVFRDLVEQNIDQMLAMSGDPARLRPHCKTHKMDEVVRLQLRRGIVKQKAATIAEVEMLARAGCTDILLAYNPVGPNVRRIVRMLEAFPEIDLAVTGDDPQMIAAIGRAVDAIGRSVGMVLDLNPGRDRTGVKAGDEAVRLSRQIANTPGLRPGGFHLYDGHQHQADLNERRAAVQVVWDAVAQLRDRLEHEGIPVPRIVCGGTPTFPVYATMTDPAIELSPGTCVFHDASYGEKFPDLGGFSPAALVFTRVVSRPMANRVTFDCGTKSVASDPPMGQRVVFPDVPDGRQVLHNEEHLVVETADAARWMPGDWTLAIPRHVCPTTALHRQVYVVSQGRLVDEWLVTARDRVLTI